MEQPRTLNAHITITVCLSSFIAAELGSLAAYGGPWPIGIRDTAQPGWHGEDNKTCMYINPGFQLLSPLSLNH